MTQKGTSLRSQSRRYIAAVVTVAALALPASAGATTLFGSGSSAAYPYFQKLFRAYSKLHHNKIKFKFIPDGGNAGVQDVQAGRSQFAIQTRLPLPSDSHTTWDKLFLDGLCIGVNPSNSVSNVSLPTLSNVFLGLDTNWGQVTGSNLTGTIDPVGRNSSAGTYTFFQQAVLNGKTQSQNVLQAQSDGLVAVAVSHDTNGIGYVGLAHSGNGSGIKTVTVDGVACDKSHIRNGTYPLWRNIWSVLPTSDPSIAVERFFDWVRTSVRAGRVISAAGAVPEYNQ